MPKKKPIQPKKLSKAEKDLMRCEICGKEFIEVVGETGSGPTGRVFKPNCKHYPKEARFCIG